MTTRPALAFGGFRRGGSSVGFMILQHLLAGSGIACRDLVKDFHAQGIKLEYIPAPLLVESLRTSALSGCFRAAPRVDPQVLAQTPLFLLVRDPRDCQISWMHGRHLHGNDIDPPTIRENAALHEDLVADECFDADIASLLDWCQASGGRIFRYEDMVADPLAFIDAFAQFSGLPLDRGAIDLALLQATFLQPVSDTGAHNRQGMPYAALRTLAPAELAPLTRRFSTMLNRLGYPPDAASAAQSLPPLDVSALIQRDALKRYVQALANQNGLRIAEIQRLEEELGRLRAELEAVRASLPPQ